MAKKMQFLKHFFLIIFSLLAYVGEMRGANIDSQNDSMVVANLLIYPKQQYLKNFPDAVKDAAHAIALVEKTDNKRLLFKVYKKIGLIYEENNHVNEAAQYYQKCLNLLDNVSDSLKLDIYIDWAIINKKLNHFKISRDYYNQALTLAMQKGDLETVEFAYNGLGTLHDFLGEFDLAIQAYLHSIEYAKKGKNLKGVVLTLVNISAVYMEGKNFSLALENAKKAYDLAISLKDSSKIGFIYNTFGKILNEQNNYTDALDYHKKALSVFENTGEKQYIVRTLIFISEVYLKKADYFNASQYLIKCLQFKDNLTLYDQPNLYLKLGNLYQKTGENENAINALRESIVLAKTRGFKDIIQKGNYALSQVYEQSGNHKLAYDCLHTANIYGDSIFSQENARRFAEAQYKFDVEKAEAQYIYEKELSEKRIQDIKLQQSRYWLATILIIFSAVIFTLIYIVKMKSKSNLVLLQKNQEIKFQNERLEKSNEILRQFAYASAHDLKEPLRSICSFVHIIDRRYSKLLPPEASEYMNFITSGVKRMESLLSALLEYSTVASEEQEVKQVTSIRQVLTDVQENLRSTITEKNAHIEIGGALPSLWISRLHLTQLFQNLLSNSMKFSDKQPQIAINAKMQNDSWLITLQDNGIGMKTEYSDKIFRLFQRLSRSPQYEGTGIGLSICKHIVDKYNGKIWFESVEGEGTTFFISFPLSVVKFEREFAIHTEGGVLVA